MLSRSSLPSPVLSGAGTAVGEAGHMDASAQLTRCQRLLCPSFTLPWGSLAGPYSGFRLGLLPVALAHLTFPYGSVTQGPNGAGKAGEISQPKSEEARQSDLHGTTWLSAKVGTSTCQWPPRSVRVYAHTTLSN